jgi:hypothetical protein
LQVAVFLPLAVGAGFAGEYCIARINRIIVILVCIFFLTITFVGYPVSVLGEIRKVYGGEYFQFPKRGYVDAMKFVRTITSINETVLALPLTGQMIPSYANRTVYVGNKEYYTKDLSKKMDDTWVFYKGIPMCEAFLFVKNNKIHTIFYGFDEQKAGDAVTRYPFLKRAGVFGETEVFRFDEMYTGCR